MTDKAMREAFDNWCGETQILLELEEDEAWNIFCEAWKAALQWAAEGQKPFGFITEESVWRLENGGNNKGAVPIHKHASNTARTPLYAAPVPNKLLAEVERLRKALSFYADETRYWGPNTPLREQKESSARPDGCAAETMPDGAIARIEWCAATVRAIADLGRHQSLGDMYPQAVMAAATLRRVLEDFDEQHNAIAQGREHSERPTGAEG